MSSQFVDIDTYMEAENALRKVRDLHTKRSTRTGTGHRPKPDGSCSLACSCPTPLTQAEADLLGDLGIF